MASTIHDQETISSQHPERKNKSDGVQKRMVLEQEVAKLREMLEYEERVHGIMEKAFHGHVTSIPSFLPPKTKELLAELAMVQEEIARLESEISNLQHSLTNELRSSEASKSRQWQRHVSLNSFSKPEQSPKSPSNFTPKHMWVHQSQPPEARALFYINQAIKGDHAVNGFTRNIDKNMENSFGGFEEKERQKDVVGFQYKISKKSGIIERPFSTPRLPPKHPRSKAAADHDHPEISFNLLRNALSETSPLQESTQKWQPNKLSESIMKCLICIFLRLMRTSRTMELEKSGAITRSSHSLSSRSFRFDRNFKASSLLAKEPGQKDPYGIFDTEGSIARDIGAYKNYVSFTSNSFDVKSFSSSIPLLRKLRVLMNNLHSIDLSASTYQQKLAFWINMYNACIMHAFLQYGFPSSQDNLISLMNKATIEIGGNKLSALEVENLILRQPVTSKEVYWKGEKNEREDVIRNLYGLEYPEPNVMFSLTYGTRSSPAVRIYKADGVLAELEKSKLEYLQAAIAVTSSRRLMVPELLLWNMPNFQKDLDSLVEWICNQLPTSGSLRKSMIECLRGSNMSGRISDASIQVVPYEFEFQFLLGSKLP